MYIIKAEAEQIEKIVNMSVRAFETDVNVGGIKGDCPPEYDSIKWHQQMAREGHLYQAMIGNLPLHSRMKQEKAYTLAGFLSIASIIEKVTEFA